MCRKRTIIKGVGIGSKKLKKGCMVHMPTISFREFDEVCLSLGLEKKMSKKGHIWKGISPISNEYVRISVHLHSSGRDIPTGTLMQCIKELGFKDFHDFQAYLSKLWAASPSEKLTKKE